MGGKTEPRVKCPRCRKHGILRLKQKGKNAVIVYHYDKKRYEKGTNGTKSCYIGSIGISTYKIYGKFFPGKDRYNEYDYFTKVWEKLKRGFQSEDKVKDVESTSEVLEKFAAILNELRKIKGIEEKSKKVKGQKIWWSIRCPKCRTGIQLHAMFHGVDRRKPIGLDTVPSEHIHYRKIDATKDVIFSSFFHIFQPFPVVFSL